MSVPALARVVTTAKDERAGPRAEGIAARAIVAALGDGEQWREAARQ